MNKAIIFFFLAFAFSSYAWAGTTIPLTVNLSEAVTVTGTPRVAVDVGGQMRYATYTNGSGTSTLTFTLSPQAGDVDLDGITVSSPVDLNGGTMKDAAGNNATLTFTPPNTSGIKVNYPSLGMDFVYDADGRYTLNGTVYNDLTSFLAASGGSFTRASTATYFDSTGTLQTAASGVPRFDYDPITHAPKGILIEESRANIRTYSDQLDNAVWTRTNSSVSPNVGLSPNGTMAADKLIEDTSSGIHCVGSWPSPYSNLTTYQQSAFFKAGERSKIALHSLGLNNTSFDLGHFDLSNGTRISGQGSISSVGGGWFRVTVSIKTGNPSTAPGLRIYILDNSGNTSYVGDGVSGVYVWGVQVEQGLFPTSYIPTTSAAVTRAADVFFIPTAGWFNAAETTLVASAQLSGKASGGRFQFGLGVNASNYLGFPYVDSLSFLSSAYYRALGAGPVVDPPDLSFNTLYKAGYAFSTTAGTSSYSLNGVLSGTGAGVASMSGTPTLTLGYAPFNLNQVSGYIERLKYYPSRVTDAQLQLLTQ